MTTKHTSDTALSVLKELISNPSLIDWAIEYADEDQDIMRVWELIKKARTLIKKTEFDEVRVSDHPTEAVDLDHDLDEIDAAEYLAAIAKATSQQGQ